MTIQSPFTFANIIGFIFATITLSVVTSLVTYLLKRMWRKKKSKLVWTPISSADHRSNLSYDEFVREYASVGKPVIITDAIKDWKASTKWTMDQYGSVKDNCRLGRAIALPNLPAFLLGFVPQPNLREIRFLALTEPYWTMDFFRY